jgi:multiple sugar transport system ATP-binding protein
MGDLTHVYTDLAGVECIVTVSSEKQVSEDDEIEIVFPPLRIHIFDGETGKAIKNRETQQDVDDQVTLSS